MATLLSLVQTASSEINIPQPSSLVSSTDDQAIQLLALAQREGKQFYQRANKNGGWQALHKEYQFTTAAVTGLTGTLTSGSPIITGISSTAGIVAGTWALSGTGIPNAAYVLSVDSGTQVTMSMNATASGTGVALSFGQNAYALPSDFKYFVDKSFWDGNYRWQLLGPIEAQEKNVLQYGISPVGPRKRFWIRNNKLYLQPTPSDTTSVIAYDYYSNAWCLSALGVAQSAWTADTDTYALDEDCFVLGIKWRFLRAKGMDYEQEYRDYEDLSSQIMARDGGGRDLPLGARGTEINILGSANIPDSGFGS